MVKNRNDILQKTQTKIIDSHKLKGKEKRFTKNQNILTPQLPPNPT